MLSFSATIFDAISTESTLFIRQNQLVYYFTGRYSTLFDTSHSSSEKAGLGVGGAEEMWVTREAKPRRMVTRKKKVQALSPWCTPVIPTLGRQRQGDQEFMVVLSHIASLR